QRGHPDEPRAEVLMAVHPAAERRLRVVPVDHREPVPANPCLERRQEAVDGLRVADPDTSSPEMGDVEAEADPIGICAVCRDRLEDGLELVDRDADAATAARRVLEDEE